MPLSWINHLSFVWRHRQIRDQKGLRITAFFRMMAFTLVNIFSIVFVYKYGSQYHQANPQVSGLIFVLTYLATLELTVVTTAIPMAQRVINVIGYRKSLALSLIFSALGFISLALTSYFGWLISLMIAPIFIGLGAASFWTTYHVLFVDDVTPHEIGSSFGMIEAFIRMGQVVAPLLGAAITVLWGFEVLFVSGIGLLICAGLPMLFLKHHLHFDNVSWHEFVTWSKEKRFLRFAVAAMGRGVDERLLAGVWPVYVFLVVGSVEGLGLFQSTVLFFTAIFGMVVAKLFDYKSKRIFQAIGVLGGVTFWSIRIWLKSLSSIMLADSIDRIFTTTSRVFFFGYAFRRARGRQSLSFVVYWAVWEAIGLFLVYTTLILGLLILGLELFWVLVAIVGSLGLLATLLIEDHK